MVELIAFGCVIALFGLIALFSWGFAKVYDRRMTKRWEKAKANDGYLRLLIECAKTSHRRYIEASTPWCECREAIDELRKGNEYRTRAEVAERLELADNLCAKCQELEANAAELRHIAKVAQTEFETYCVEKGYKPWG